MNQGKGIFLAYLPTTAEKGYIYDIRSDKVLCFLHGNHEQRMNDTRDRLVEF